MAQGIFRPQVDRRGPLAPTRAVRLDKMGLMLFGAENWLTGYLERQIRWARTLQRRAMMITPRRETPIMYGVLIRSRTKARTMITAGTHGRLRGVEERLLHLLQEAPGSTFKNEAVLEGLVHRERQAIRVVGGTTLATTPVVEVGGAVELLRLLSGLGTAAVGSASCMCIVLLYIRSCTDCLAVLLCADLV